MNNELPNTDEEAEKMILGDAPGIVNHLVLKMYQSLRQGNNVQEAYQEAVLKIAQLLQG